MLSFFSPPPPPPAGFGLGGALDVLSRCHLTADAVLLTLALASLWANHLWRALAFGVGYAALLPLAASLAGETCAEVAGGTYASLVLHFILFVGCVRVPCSALLNRYQRRQPVAGAVFVTGADSGMGWWTARKLAAEGYHVYAGCFSDKSFAELRAKVAADFGRDAAARLTEVRERSPAPRARSPRPHPSRIAPHPSPVAPQVSLDVTDDGSVSRARGVVEKAGRGLVGIINCAGMGFNGVATAPEPSPSPSPSPSPEPSASSSP